MIPALLVGIVLMAIYIVVLELKVRDLSRKRNDEFVARRAVEESLEKTANIAFIRQRDKALQEIAELSAKSRRKKK